MTGFIPALLRQPLLRTQLAAVAMAVLLCLVGANGTTAIPLALRLGYWLILMIGGTLIAQVIGALVDRSTRFNTWQECLVMLVCIMPPITLLVWLVTSLFTGQTPNLARLPAYFPPVAIISVAMTLIHTQINRTPAQSHAFREDRITEPGSALRERLGFKFRTAEIYALSAEDHYLRVHSSVGETLILMRLYDAIRELDGIEGSQTHRSWWVAKEAVTAVKRRDGRVTLALKGDVTAPVSRSYLKALKSDGWL